MTGEFDPRAIRFASGPVVATIGVFDGLHRGHRRLLEMVRERAVSLTAFPLVISFDPHPVEVLAPYLPAQRLATRAQKIRTFAECGVESAWLLPFSRGLASLEAEAFLEFLLARVALRELWIGADFRFGRNRRGDAALLASFGRAHGFDSRIFSPVVEAGRTISSSWVRESLAVGEIERATTLLGHRFVLEGRVGQGRGEGAKLLVATANLDLAPQQCLPGRGVYAGWAEVEGSLHPAAINVGRRPTLTADLHDTVEVHLIDWSGELRGHLLPVHFGHRLREERRFSGLEELRAAVEVDIAEVRAWLAAALPPIGDGQAAGRPA